MSIMSKYAQNQQYEQHEQIFANISIVSKYEQTLAMWTNTSTYKHFEQMPAKDQQLSAGHADTSTYPHIMGRW